MIEMTVIGLFSDPKTAQPIVVLIDNENLRGLPIWIGRAEATAISIALDERKTERPLTHGLISSILEFLEYEVERVEIDSLDRTTYKATIVLNSTSQQTDLKFVDARPSDAIAIALNAKAPILVSNSLEFVVNDELQLELNFRKFLKDLKASDFNKYKKDRFSSCPGEPENDLEFEAGIERQIEIESSSLEIKPEAFAIDSEVQSQTQSEVQSEEGNNDRSGGSSQSDTEK